MSKYMCTAVALLLAGPAFAGSAATPALSVTQVVSAATTDWSGYYIGALVSLDAGELNPTNPTSSPPFDVIYDLTSQAAFGGFAGYNFQNGAFVYGVEGAISSGGLAWVNNPTQHHGYFVDLKARGGFATGNTLIYGVAGMSLSHWRKDYFDTATPLLGVNYGVGLDYRINDQLFVGAEYLFRSLRGDGNKPGALIDSNTQSAQLRVGWKF